MENILGGKLFKQVTVAKENLLRDLRLREGKHISKFYRMSKMLGAGSFGDVWMCVQRETGAHRAVKVTKSKIFENKEKDAPKNVLEMQDEDESTAASQELKNEIRILCQLDHPNVVRIHESFQDDHHTYIVLEICKGGELNDEMQIRGKFSEDDVAKLMRQVLSCINYLHNKNIAHRDLKPENILLENNKDLSQIKVADFGTAIQWDPKNKQPFKEKVGTLIYMAPEVFTGSYSEKCDIWSCGVLMYKLLSTRFPFEGEDEVTLRQKLTVGEFDLTSSEWSSVKPDLKDLLKGMLQTNPDKRLTADEAVNHAFFKRKPTDALVIDIDKSKMKKKQLEEVESGAIIKGALTNFLQFSAKSKAKISIYSYFTSELLSKAELNIITSVFKELDKDGDGVLKYRELMDSYKKYAPELAGEFEQKGNGLLKMVNLGCRRPGNLDDYVSYSRFIMAAMKDSSMKMRMAASVRMSSSTSQTSLTS
ncbi:hypothetical protein FGO68_gene14120 [Halteria grandinella]|uniref:Calcium-dependent protein kinase n=1 Tax=Halteria grandinella TaxID=5974 RepID=A0A8J8T470_HALGN|nr:hypothetical protein FGO68_gene14120 [Halteria grandinella]